MQWKFEYIFTFLVVLVLSGALIGAFITKNSDLINVIVTSFVGGLSAITAFFFTKHTNKKE